MGLVHPVSQGSEMMPRVRGRGLGASLAMMGVLVTGGPSVSIAREPVTPIWVHSVVDQCQDVLFVGARGSGEPPSDGDGMGARVAQARDVLAAAVSSRRIGFTHVIYPAHGVPDVLLTNPRAYFKGLDTGFTNTTDFLKRRVKTCPSEHYVLAGYSQGAMVMHRVLTWLRTKAIIPAGRLDGALLIADGDRRSDGKEVRRGSAPKSAVGVTWRTAANLWTTHDAGSDTFPGSWGTRIQSICDDHDAVCHASYWAGAPNPGAAIRRLVAGSVVHGTHYRGDSATRAAAVAIAARIMARPAVPAMQIVTTELPDATVGEPYTTQLQTAGGVAPYDYIVTGDSLAPPGLELAHDGTLSGTPTLAGRHVFTANVEDANGQVVETDVVVVTTDPSPPSGDFHFAVTAELSGNTAGSTVDYTFLLTNSGSQALSPVNVSDSLDGPVSCPSTVPAGETVSCSSSHVVTQAEVDAGHVVNLATAQGGGTVSTQSLDTVIAAVPNLTLDLQAGVPTGTTEGSTIDYVYHLLNVGNVTLHPIQLDDGVTSPVCPVDTLAPGGSETCTATYALTEGDIAAGQVTVTATAIATAPDGSAVSASDSVFTPLG